MCNFIDNTPPITLYEEVKEMNGGRYYNAERFETTDQVIERCERESGDSEWSKNGGCVTFLVITLLGLASLAGTLIISIKWA